MAFTIGSGTFTNGSATVTGVTLTSGTLAYFASGTRMVVGVNPVIQEVEAIAAPTVSTITLRSAWTGTGGTYSFLANQTSEGLRDAVQAIRTNNASLQSFIDSIDTAATANSVAQRTSDGSLNAVNVYASGNAGVGTSSPDDLLHLVTSGFGGLHIESTGATSDPILKLSNNNGGTASWQMQLDKSDGSPLQFRYNNDPKVSINSSGKLLSPNGSAFIGTVSNSGNGAIIERGSNANGEYVKFADGTMICTYVISPIGLALGTAFLGGFRNANNSVTWLFPSSFVGTPAVTGNGDDFTSGSIFAPFTSPSSAAIYWLATTSQAASDRGANLIAVGRWY